jgi:DNA-binding NarL/FixJ family response regulator
VIRVLVADDQELARDGFALILDQQDDMDVVGQAADGAEAAELAARLRPDVVLMDIQMPGTDGLEGTRRILARTPQTRVLVLTTFDLDEYVLSALRIGASGYLLKDSPRAALLHAVRAVVAGDVLLSPEVARRLVDAPPPSALPADVAKALERLTPREREVLGLVAEGSTNAEIAARLHLSEPTVKTHVSHLLAKLDARDRVRLVVIAHQARHFSVF